MSKAKLINESARLGTKAAAITITADALEVETDPLVLALGPAEAIAESMRVGIRTGNAVSAATARQRKAKGISSSTKWYATGELARGLKAERDGKGFAIVAPHGRLQDDALAQKLVDDVQEVSQPVTRVVEAAIEKTADNMFTKARRR